MQNINNELKVANEELQQFAHIASHDLQEPLRKLRQFSELLIEDYAPELDEDARYFIETIRSSAQRMSNLIKETLAYSRSGSGNQKIIRIDLSNVLQQLRDEMDLATKDVNGTFVVEDLPVVLANELGMAQLFRNLMTNGLKYSKPGKPAIINISVGHGADEPENLLLIRVSDNGIGIPKKHLQRIFLPYERLNGSDVAGTGLGLAICKKVCESHGWTLEVSSEPAVGTTFLIGIPMSSVVV
ncbi:MAG: ATP-binding protein [Granulosicoccus sp.]